MNRLHYDFMGKQKELDELKLKHDQVIHTMKEDVQSKGIAITKVFVTFILFNKVHRSTERICFLWEGGGGGGLCPPMITFDR